MSDSKRAAAVADPVVHPDPSVRIDDQTVVLTVEGEPFLITKHQALSLYRELSQLVPVL